MSSPRCSLQGWTGELAETTHSFITIKSTTPSFFISFHLSFAPLIQFFYFELVPLHRTLESMIQTNAHKQSGIHCSYLKFLTCPDHIVPYTHLTSTQICCLVAASHHRCDYLIHHSYSDSNHHLLSYATSLV